MPTYRLPPALLAALALPALSQTVPGAPTLLGAHPGNGQALIVFDPPANDGGDPIIAFNATCIGPFSHNTTGPGSPLSVTGLTNGATYQCSVSASNGVGTGPSSASLAVTPATSTAIALTSVRSRKRHQGVAYDHLIERGVPIGGLVTVEPRMSEGGRHLVVFRFDNPVAYYGSVSVAPIGSAGATVSGNEILVNITGVPDNRRVTVSVIGVNGSGGGNVSEAHSLAFLAGDVGSSRATRASDLAAIKANYGQALSAGRHRFDVNLDGVINGEDLALAKLRSGWVTP